jgi:hypothetical protein
LTDQIKRSVNNALGDGFLAAPHHGVDHTRDQLAIVSHISYSLPFL